MSTIKSSAEHLTLNADGSGNDIKFQSNGSEVASISDGGVVTSTGGSTYADNVKAKFGTGNDLEIYSDGDASFIKENGSSELYIRGTNIIFKSGADNDDYIKCNENSDVKLYHSNAEKLATTSTGVNITGALTLNDQAFPAGTCAFRAKDNDGSWASIATNTKIVFDSEHEDSDNVYNTSTGYFTAPTAGTYFFYANIYTAQSDSANGFRFRKNDSAAAIEDYHGQWGSYMSQSDASDCMVSWQLVITLGTDDTIAVYTGTGSDIYYGHSYWGGFRLK